MDSAVQCFTKNSDMRAILNPPMRFLIKRLPGMRWHAAMSCDNFYT